VFAGGIAQLPAGITLVPERWGGNDLGGMKTATIRAVGTLEDLGQLLTWVGDRAEIRNDLGTPCWWGVIYEIEADLGGVTVSLSLESVVNRVAVRYSSYLPDGSTESRLTAWVQDANSIDRYGKRELLYSLPEGYDLAATTVRDRLIATLADPAPVLRSRSDFAVGATLYCRGVWDLLDFTYYTNDKGLAAHEDSSGQINLGAYYAATTISFAAADDINDGANGLAGLQAGVTFTVSGAANAGNNGVFTVQSYDTAGHIETVENTQVNEAAGPTIGIVIGDQTAISKVAMKFRNLSSGSWNAGKAALRLQRVGSPGDNLKLELCADSAGSPGSVLDDTTISGASVYDTMDWVEFTLSNTETLNTGTDYWLVVSRTGSASLVNYYIVGLDEGLGYASGGAKVYNGSWVANVPDADMPFRVVGEAYSSTQLRTTLETSTELSDVLVTVSSGITVRTYRDNERSIKEEALEMLELGTSAGDRLIATITKDRAVIVGTPPASTPSNPILGMDGRLRHPSGALWEPGLLCFGRWVNVDGLPVLDGVATKTKGSMALYIESAEYDASNGALILQSEGALDPWQAIRWRKG
jgi:hypothetical protein